MFPQNQTPGAQVTGAEDDFSAFVKQAVAEELAKQGTPGANQPAASQTAIPITLNGQTFNYNSPAELSQAIQQTFQQYNTEIERLKAAQVAPAPPASQQGATVTGQDELDLNTFVNKFTTNPREAFDYMDKVRYGVDNPVEAIKGAIATKDKVGQMQQALDVYRFRDAHPEFVSNPQNANTIQHIITNGGLTSDYNGLEAAYAIALTRGLMQIPQQQNQPAPQYQSSLQYQQDDFQPQFGRPQYPPYNQYGLPANLPQNIQDPRLFNGGAPPRVGRQSAPPAEDFAAMAEGMTPEQIEAIFTRFQS